MDCTDRRSLLYLTQMKFVYCALVVFVSLAALGVQSDAATTYSTKKSYKKKRLGFFFMWKSFFLTLFDPGYAQPLKEVASKSGKRNKGKGNKLGSSPFSATGGMPGGGSFGAVCGPNGC